MADFNTLFFDEDFSVEHLFESPENLDLIKKFSVGKNAYGLEQFIKNSAPVEENQNQTRTYLIKDRITGELACYFSLRTGLVTLEVQNGAFDSFSAVELSNFAMNQNYKENHPNVKKGGAYFFKRFILPLVKYVSSFIGISMIYIYALPENRLMAHYFKMGFSRLSEEQEKFVQHHVKPKYDEGCIFMYQVLV